MRFTKAMHPLYPHSVMQSVNSPHLDREGRSAC